MATALTCMSRATTPENQKVSLGYKKEEDNPWEQLKTDYPIGSEFVAPVVSITKFGAFVRILPGVDGLVHISEISNERVNKVSDVLKVGDEVRVKLINVDFERKRISLSMKACEGEQPMAEELRTRATRNNIRPSRPNDLSRGLPGFRRPLF